MSLRSEEGHERNIMSMSNEKMLAEIAGNISLAKHVLSESESLRNSALHQFEISSNTHILRLRPETPYCFKTAASWLAAGKQYIGEIDHATAHQSILNRSKRAIVVANLVAARVKAALASAYVEYWKGAKAMKNYEVLAHQAMAYAEACCGDNWTYFAPLVLIRPDEPLSERSAANLRLLMDYGNASFAYATCLHAQMLVAPVRKQLPQFTPVEVERTDGEDAVIEPAAFPPVRAYNIEQPGVSQEEIASQHGLFTGWDLREDAWLRIGQSSHIYPKQRLVGFARNRSGKSHKRSKKVA